MSGGLQPQAKKTSPIMHADIRGGMGGIALGAAAGVILVLSGGTTAPLWIVLLGSAGIGKSVGEMVIDPEQAQQIAGTIVDGSPDTFIGADRQKAARASFAEPRTLVGCHPGDYVSEGSETVFINRCRAGRRYDHTSCGGVISAGDDSVHTGGAPRPIFQHGAVMGDKTFGLYWALGLGLDAAGLMVAPETKVGQLLRVLDTAALGEKVLAGPKGEGGLLGTASQLGGLVPAELGASLMAVDGDVGTKTLDAIGYGVKWLGALP